MSWHGAGWAALGLLALDVSSFLVVALLVRRAPRDPAWSDLRHRPDPLPDGSCRVCGRRVEDRGAHPAWWSRFFEGRATPDTPGPSVSPPGGRGASDTAENDLGNEGS